MCFIFKNTLKFAIKHFQICILLLYGRIYIRCNLENLVTIYSILLFSNNIETYYCKCIWYSLSKSSYLFVMLRIFFNYLDLYFYPILTLRFLNSLKLKFYLIIYSKILTRYKMKIYKERLNTGKVGIKSGSGSISITFIIFVIALWKIQENRKIDTAIQRLC